MKMEKTKIWFVGTHWMDSPETRPATIGDMLDYFNYPESAGIEAAGRNNDGDIVYISPVGDFAGKKTMDEIEDIQTDWTAVEYWDGSNMQVDIFEYGPEEFDAEIRKLEDPSPPYFFRYEVTVFDEDGKVFAEFEATKSNTTGSISPYFKIVGEA